MVAYAEKLGLAAEYNGDGTIMQISFRNPQGSRLWDTHVAWTTPYSGGRNSITVFQFSRILDERGLPALRSWLKTISPTS